MAQATSRDRGLCKLIPDKYGETVSAVERIMEFEVRKRGKGFRKLWKSTDFEIDEVEALGCGAFGMVFLAREKTTGFIVALKRMNARRIREEKRMERNLMREIEIQSRLQHPNILALYNLFMRKEYIFLIMEYAEAGDLYTYMRPDGDDNPAVPVHPDLAAKWIFQTAAALAYCLTKNVLHRDIKPENILLDIYGNVKLADYGWAARVVHHERTSAAGTPLYMAPEIAKNYMRLMKGLPGVPYPSKIDNWSLGVMAYEMLTGRLPFGDELNSELLRKILVQEYTYLPTDRIDQGAVDLISNLLKKEPEERLNFVQVLKHPWVIGRCMRKPYSRELLESVKFLTDKPQTTGVPKQHAIDT